MAELVRPRSWGSHELSFPFGWLGSALLVAGALGCAGQPAPGTPGGLNPRAPSGRPADERSGSPEPKRAPQDPAPSSLGPVEKIGSIGMRSGSTHLELASRGTRTVLRFSTPPKGDLLVALDDHRPRPLGSELREIRLTKLLPEDSELAPGSHHLILCGRSESLMDCSLLAFLMDSEGDVKEAAAKGSTCFLLEPGGTYWGEGQVPFLALVMGGEGGVDAVSYRLTHSLGEQTVRSVTGEKLQVKLSVGDTMVEFGCGTSGTVSVRRAITVNPESRP